MFPTRTATRAAFVARSLRPRPLPKFPITQQLRLNSTSPKSNFPNLKRPQITATNPRSPRSPRSKSIDPDPTKDKPKEDKSTVTKTNEERPKKKECTETKPFLIFLINFGPVLAILAVLFTPPPPEEEVPLLTNEPFGPNLKAIHLKKRKDEDNDAGKMVERDGGDEKVKKGGMKEENEKAGEEIDPTEIEDEEIDTTEINPRR